jgi:beta-mannanase
MMKHRLADDSSQSTSLFKQPTRRSVLRMLGITGAATITGASIGSATDSNNSSTNLNGEQYDSSGPPTLGIYSGLSDADFDTIQRMEEWQGAPYPIQNLFVPWNPDTGHMDWLFEQILPKIWDAGRVPLITWEPFTPDTQAASVDTRSLVERDQYDVYLESLADTTPNDIEVRISNGEYDQYIKHWTRRLRKWLAGPDGQLGTGDDRQAYIRLAHEMNGDWYPWSPTVGDSSAADYVKMWQHVYRQFRHAGIDAENVEWMWCVNADDVGSYTAEKLYPGNEYVDWLSVDGYQWGESREWSHWRSPKSIFSNMFNRVRNLADKPLCVPETASSSKTHSGYNPKRKDEWIRSAFEYFNSEGVEMWCWFNEDKETDWAIFNGMRGTEKITYNGETVNAYAAYREAVDSDSTTANQTESKPMTITESIGEN